MSDTRTVTLTEFLLARISEDEASVRGYLAREGTAFAEDHWPWNDMSGPTGDSEYLAVHIGVGRVLAECAAKRRIVEEALSAESNQWRAAMTFALLALASVYADHPDYRDEWRG